MTLKEGETRNEYGFYTYDPDTEGNLEPVKDRLKCIDESFEIKGHYDSYTAANLMVVYEICNNYTGEIICKSKE